MVLNGRAFKEEPIGGMVQSLQQLVVGGEAGPVYE
jgi:hypothetical protein